MRFLLIASLCAGCLNGGYRNDPESNTWNVTRELVEETPCPIYGNLTSMDVTLFDNGSVILDSASEDLVLVTGQQTRGPEGELLLVVDERMFVDPQIEAAIPLVPVTYQFAGDPLLNTQLAGTVSYSFVLDTPEHPTCSASGTATATRID